MLKRSLSTNSLRLIALLVLTCSVYLFMPVQMIGRAASLSQSEIKDGDVERAKEAAITTVILVRHAEKTGDPGANPPLSDAGRERAQLLQQMLGSAEISAIYTSQFERTRATAQPLAAQLGITIKEIDVASTNQLVDQINSQRGKTVLVVGHSNTLPQIIAALGGGNVAPIAESEYDNLYIVTILSRNKVKVVRLKYGKTTGAQ